MRYQVIQILDDLVHLFLVIVHVIIEGKGHTFDEEDRDMCD
ncbi:hypothetical protein SAMN05421677_11580 [Halobacillus aidingensis]|uniref:Uncharacterized protein n=1 Tax=Halobacillus aidingensis TaxID=240303 RepID=A0A1H0RKV2_HALAD|nr:hypothetical protein SAMN05421677_11580 [Halobacillus aidingensis]